MFKYGENEEFFSKNRLEKISKTSDGFTIFDGKKHYIFYDETKNNSRIRFTIAHELGHILCDDKSKQENYGMRSSVTNQEVINEEEQADIFASILLSPACVLRELNLFTIRQISKRCKIGWKSAAFLLEQLFILEKRKNEVSIIKERGQVQLSPVENDIVKQFEAYISNNKIQSIPYADIL